MSAKSNYLENALLDHALGTAAMTMPANTFLALYSNDPGEDGSGTELTAESGYARQPINFGSAVGGVADSSDAQTFASSSGEWPACTHFGIHDALTAGNLLYKADFSSGIIIGTGGHTFGAGDIQVRED